MDSGRLQFSVGLDTRGLRADAETARRSLEGIGASAQREGARLDAVFGGVRRLAAGVFSGASAVGFAREVVGVRREIEGLEISFRTLLGSRAEADALFGGLRAFAAETPMGLQDLARGAQTLLGFGMAGEEVMPILRAIGDISMGDSQKFQALTLAFSQASSAGKLMGQDLMQMINAGFNPLAQMSEATGKSIGALKEEMAAGAISADALREAFLGAAAEGGRYHGMLASQSEGIAGSLAQLQGAWADMLNGLGEASQGAITAALRGAGALVKNYQAVGREIAALAGAYGVYKAVVMGAEAGKRAAASLALQQEAAALEGLISAEGRARLSKAGLARGTHAYSARVKQLAAEEARRARPPRSARSWSPRRPGRPPRSGS